MNESRSSSAGPILGLLLLALVVAGVAGGIYFLRSPGEPQMEERGPVVVDTPVTPAIPEPEAIRLDEPVDPKRSNHPITFRVVCLGADGASQPLVDLDVKATPIAGFALSEKEAVVKKTGPDGMVVFADMPFDAYHVEAKPADGYPLYVRGVKDGDRITMIYGDSFAMKGQVLSAEDNQPIEGVYVQLVSQLQGDLLRNAYLSKMQQGGDADEIAGLGDVYPAFRVDAYTDAEGRFSFPYAPSGYAFNVNFDHPDYDQYVEKLIAEKGNDIDLEQIRLLRRSSIFGVVTDAETSEPLPGVKVVATEGGVPLEMIQQFGGGADIFEAETDEQGHYKIDNVLRGRQYVQIAHPGYDKYEQSFQYKDLEPLELNIALKRGARLAGRVLDTAGRPVAGATLYWIYPGTQIFGGAGTANQERIKSAADGSFAFQGMPVEQPLVLVCNHPSYVESRNENLVLQPGEELSSFEVILSQGGSITGFVRAGEQPIEGAVIVAQPSNPSGRAYPAVASGKDGSYSIPNTKSALYDVTCEAEGFCSMTLRNVRDVATGVNFNMVRGATLKGLVVGRQSGEPVDLFTVRWKNVEDSAGRRVKKDVIRSEDGSFEIPNLVPGTFTFEVSAEGYAPVLLESVTLAEAQVLDRRVELVQGTTVRGRVAGQNGEGIKAALVRFEELEKFVQSEEDYTKHQATTDANGEYEMPNMIAGRFRAWASHPRYASAKALEVVLVGDVEESVDLTLQRPAQLRLKVVDENGFPMTGAKVSLFQGGSPMETADRVVDAATGRVGINIKNPARRDGFGSMDDADSSKSFMNVPADSSGELVWTRKEPGEWTLWISAPGYARYTERLTLIAGKEIVHVAEMDPIQEGGAGQRNRNKNEDSAGSGEDDSSKTDRQKRREERKAKREGGGGDGGDGGGGGGR